MCLETITKKPKKHHIGFKILRKNDGHYNGQVYETGPYYIGKTYDAQFGSEDLPTVVVASYPERKTYPAGFHYYLKMKDAKRLANDHEVVMRIIIANVLATGKQSGYDAGVSQFMTLDRLVFDPREDTMKQFSKFLTGKLQNKLLQFAKKSMGKVVILQNDLKDMADCVTKSDDDFINYITLVDGFPRSSECFKTFTAVHMWGLNNHKEYKRFYHRVVENVDKLHDRMVQKNYSDLFYLNENIDQFVLQM